MPDNEYQITITANQYGLLKMFLSALTFYDDFGARSTTPEKQIDVICTPLQ
jgi:hypothetical protein